MLNKIFYVPQLPIYLRYQQWHLSKFMSEFDKLFQSHQILTKTLGLDSLLYNKKMFHSSFSSDENLFSSSENSILFELEQIKEFNSIDINCKDDVLFLSDLSYPGFFSNILYHKKIRAYAYCHATSLNYLDIFSNDVESKSLVERGHSKLFNNIFVGSKYHASKLINSGWENVEVLGLPIPPHEVFKEEKIYDVISVARKCEQKIDYELEESLVADGINIIRKECNSWEEYYKFLSQAKILLITSKEDTFNYSIMEAILNNTIVLAPNRCSYPELLDKRYIYNNYDDLKELIYYYLYNYKEVPKLLNFDLCKNFFENVNNFLIKSL